MGRRRDRAGPRGERPRLAEDRGPGADRRGDQRTCPGRHRGVRPAGHRIALRRPRSGDRARTDRVVLPTVSSAEQVREADGIVDAFERQRGLPGVVELHLALETAEGNLHAMEIIAASARVRSVSLGRADLVMDLRPEPNGELHMMPYLLQRLVTVARAGGVEPIGAWWDADSRGMLASPEATLRAARRARRHGFRGGMGVGASQVDPLNAGFTPDVAEVARAEALVQAFETARARGERWGLEQGQIVDAARAETARRVIAQAEQCRGRDAAQAGGRHGGRARVGGSRTMEVRRSVLFMAINNPRFLRGAARHNCDGVILDLEDALAERDKVSFPALPRTAYAEVSRGGATVQIRINHMYWEADLDGAVWPGPRGDQLPEGGVRRRDPPPRPQDRRAGAAARYPSGHDRDPGLGRDGPRGNERLRDRHRQPARADLRRRRDGLRRLPRPGRRDPARRRARDGLLRHRRDRLVARALGLHCVNGVRQGTGVDRRRHLGRYRVRRSRPPIGGPASTPGSPACIPTGSTASTRATRPRRTRCNTPATCWPASRSWTARARSPAS